MGEVREHISAWNFVLYPVAPFSSDRVAAGRACFQLDPCPLLPCFNQLGVVCSGLDQGHGVFEVLEDQVWHVRVELALLEQLFGDSHILHQQRELEAGGILAWQRLGREAVSRREVSARTDVENIDHLDRIEVKLLTCNQRVGQGDDGRSTDIVCSVFIAWPAPEGPM